MKPQRAILPILGMCLAAGALSAQDGRLPQVDFKSLAKSEAKSIEDFQGRLVLLEVFAYW